MAEGNPMTRYARQMILPQVGPSGQETLAAARVGVVGAGGIGFELIAALRTLQYEEVAALLV